MKLKQITLALFTVFSASLFAQEDWKLVTSSNDVNFYQKKVLCTNGEDMTNSFFLLKVENTNTAAVDVSWKVERYAGERCLTCQYDFVSRKHPILAGESIEGTCGMYNRPELKFMEEKLETHDHGKHDKHHKHAAEGEKKYTFELKKIAVEVSIAGQE